MFGAYVRELRLAKDLGLREFCRAIQMDPSFWSKIERDITPPPQSHDALDTIARALGLSVGSKEWTELHDQAAISSGKIPGDLLSDEEIVAALPMVFRTVRGDRPTEADLNNLVDKIRHRKKG